MNEKYYIKNNNGTYDTIVTDEVLGVGGFGCVYGIKSPIHYRDCCVKTYKDRKKLELNRLEYMIQNPPTAISHSDRFKICWPMTIVYDNKYEPVGFIMSKSFHNSRDLNILRFCTHGKQIHDRFKKEGDRAWWYKYERETDEGFVNRMKILCNYAIAINTLHKTDNYVLVDIKPENIHATADGKISIIDTDSFQITKNGKLLFNGPAATADYFPRHGDILQKNGKPMDVDCDRFAMAVMFYMILIGPHPYNSLIKMPPYDNNYETIRQSIDAGLYAYGPKMNKYLKFPIPNPHKRFSNLSRDMQHLFMQAFSDNPNKPSAEEWAECFIDQIRRYEETIAERKRLQLIQQKAREAKERRQKIIKRVISYAVIVLGILGIYKGISATISSYCYHHTEYKALLVDAETHIANNRYDDAIKALRSARDRKSSAKKINAINERITEVQSMKNSMILQLNQEIKTILNTFKTTSFKYGRPENDFKKTQEKINRLKSLSNSADCDKYQAELDYIRKRKI